MWCVSSKHRKRRRTGETESSPATTRIMEAVDLDRPDDDAAKQSAQQFVDDHDVELWHGPRKVETLKHKSSRSDH